MRKTVYFRSLYVAWLLVYPLPWGQRVHFLWCLVLLNQDPYSHQFRVQFLHDFPDDSISC